MPKFAAPAKQAARIMQQLQGRTLRSVGTVRNYEQALTRVAEYSRDQRLNGLRSLTPEQAVHYLEQRGQTVGQKTLDMERQAIQAMMHHLTSQLGPTERLPVIKATTPQKLVGRAYTPLQTQMIAQAQRPPQALATQIAYQAGLRAHELLTLRPLAERPPDDRPALSSKWEGREGLPYTVAGKGGLIREVRIPPELAQQLEQRRLDTPRTITDRGIHYQQHYALAGGQRWSNAFSAAAKRVLGWSEGAHGLRHSYAQERLQELQRQGLRWEYALETVSQEMGHFRPQITEVYLR
ncbi:MAG: site-specific integrase [Candidatus Competibacteraceae bacterium]|jgi:integrase|nr:site-specific integrase [Candidatus Competibacteraceae bacterium]